MAFMAAAFLAPLAEPIAAQIEGEARATLADVFKIARRQRRRMLREAGESGRDMTGALVELVTDGELRRVIRHAYSALSASPPPVAIVEASTTPQNALESPTRPPTGGGSPAALPAPKRQRASKRTGSGVIRLTPQPAAERIAAVMATWPGISIRQLAKRAGVSESTASKWRALHLQQAQEETREEIAQ